MAVTNVATVTGSSGSFDINASGSGFGIFSSYSAYASEAVTYGSNSAVNGTGSFGLSLDTSFGSLVFSGTDTIGASNGAYSFTGSETLSFVTGADTLTFAAGSISGGSSLSSLSNDLNNFYSSITSLNSVVVLSDSVAAAAAADVASDVALIVSGVTPTVAGSSSQITQQGVQFHFTKTS